MGFDRENEQNNNDKQMSLFDFKMAQHDFVPSSTKVSAAVNYSWDYTHREPEESKTPRFVTVSAAIHAAAVIIIGMLSVPLVEQAKTETITIEIAEPSTPRLPTKGEPVLPTKGGTTAIAETRPAIEDKKDIGGPGDIVVAKAPEKIKAPAPAKPVKVVKAAKASAKIAKTAPATAGRSVAPKATIKAVPMTIDDINSPELDAGELASAKVASTMNEDYNEDFDKIDNSHSRAVEDEQGKLNAMASAMAADQENSLNELNNENQEQAAQFAADQKALRKKNAKAIASALSSERAAAAARAQAQREAAAQAAAARAAQSGNGLGGRGNGYGQGEGAGAGNNGVDQASNQIAGSATGIRSLDQLRQMPGNPRPQYDREERLRGDQGKVSFVAYITKEGVPVKFRQTKSTGFTNLDSKTLDALKKWRFYPGQEGWVEMPFRWDLKGGAQQDGGRLRTSVSQR